jgi:flagellar biosynthetic protein FlhB
VAATDKHARTEDPTPKRKREARANGQVARSPDVGGWALVLLGVFLLPWFFNQAKARMLGVLTMATYVGRHPTTPGALVVLEAGLKALLLTVAPLGGIFVLVAIVANLAQIGRTFSFKAARPKLSRISPKQGLTRLLSARNGVQLLKQLVKLLVLVGVGYKTIVAVIHEMANARVVSLLPVVAATASSIVSFVRVLSLLGLAIGIVDFLYQRRKLKESLKMTKEEVKEERKSAEGDPHVKGEMRKRMYSLARSRVLAAVANADVVVTNPTHFAVALAYDPKRSSAPRVVAKGADLLAARIRAQAEACFVPIVEDPPLARYLFAICEVDGQIPPEIYVAVARLLAFIYSLPASLRGVGVHHFGSSIVPSKPEALALLREPRRTKATAVLTGTGGR